MKYYCHVESNTSYPRQYETDSRSALVNADRFGRFEGGEIVTVTNKHGRVIDRAAYSPEDGGKYYKVAFDPDLNYWN